MPFNLHGVNVQEFPLFQNLEEEVARKFVAMGFHFKFEAGTPLVSNTDQGDTFFLILSGLAKLVLINSQKEEVHVTLFKAGDCFGELAILEPHLLRSANIIAMTPIDVIAVQKNEFLKTVDQHPGLGLNLARILGQRLRAMNERMVTSRMPDDVHKVAHTMLILANKGTAFTEQGIVILPQLTLKEWAAFCYTGSQGFMDSMEELKLQGAIEWQNQKIVITDLDMLKQCAEVHQKRIDSIQAKATL